MPLARHKWAMRLALFQPEIPQNVGTILRLAACLETPVDIIEPCGFVWSDRALKRAGMDYAELATVTLHADWRTFLTARSETSRLILLTTRASQTYVDFAYRPDDILLFGQESAGVPPIVHDAADARLRIPLRQGLRSLNLAVSAAMVLGEALRQTGGFPASHTATE